MVEYVPFKHGVAGSSPVAGTFYGGLTQLGQEYSAFNRGVVGSQSTAATRIKRVVMYLRNVLASEMPWAADWTAAHYPIERGLCGRVTNVRRQGGVCFVTIQDHTGRTQLFGQRNVLGDQYTDFCQLIVGSCVHATGHVGRTTAGEPSLFVSGFEVSGMAYDRPPLGQVTADGIRMNALEDIEECRRNRHLDMMSNLDTMSRFVSRSQFISNLRSYLCSAKYLEVETPILQEQATGASAATFNTHHNEMNQEMQLRIALEIHLKLCIMGGFDRVFELGRVFRNEGVSSRHNPEFTLLEMYAAWTDLSHMQSEAEHIVRMAYEAYGRSLPEFQIFTMQELVGQSENIMSDFESRIVHTLIEPTFVTNHPLSDSPFAQEDVSFPGTARRFELYINGVEVANAYQEINDANEQLARLRQPDGTLAPMDAYFVNAMRNGMPPTSGLGIGIDRLVMLASGLSSIRDIVLFPAMRNTGGIQML